MGQTLTNGIFLPNEGERNCYTGLEGNWRAIDGYIGAYNVHVADVVIHVSQEDRDKWDAVDNKADASALTAHTGDTTIHVTAADKEAWNGKADASALTAHTGDTTIHVTAEDKSKWNAVTSKANDTDVLHKSGDETAAGIKTFSDDTYFKSLNVTNEVASQSSSGSAILPLLTTITYRDETPSATARFNLRITAAGEKSLFPHEGNQYSLGLASRKWSAVYGTAFYYGSNAVEFSQKFVTTDTAQTIGGVKTFSDIPIFTSFDGIRFRCAHNSNAYVTFRNSNQANPGSIIFSANDGNVSTSIHLVAKTLIPYNTADIDLGTSLRKWNSFNGINPGALSLPNLSAGVDISSYITNLNKSINTFTPPANGWMFIRVKKSALDHVSIQMQQQNGLISSTETVDFSTWGCHLPVVASKAVEIYIYADSVASAYFYPCQGNI